MVSTRLPASLMPTPLAAAVAARRRRPERLLDLTLSNPTIAGLAYPETLATAFSNVAALRYDPEPRGLRSARDAVAAWHASIGEPVSADQLVLTASTSEAYSMLFKLLCDPGDRVLVPCPSYPLFEHLAHLDAVGADRYTFRDAGRWILDEDQLHASITSRTRALIVVSPNNPTGHVPTPREWEVLGEVCRRHGLAMIVDEVFSAYPLAPDVAHLHTPDVPGVLMFRLNGLSKLVGLPQAKLGWILVRGPADDVGRALDALDMIADTYLSVATPVQVGLPLLLEVGSRVRRQILDRVRSNLALVTRRVAGSTIDVRAPDGGWTVVLRVPCIGEPDDVPMALLERDVLVHPGYFYDLPHDGYVVISLLAVQADLHEGLEALCSLPLLQIA
jgi:alanine-synthesizing transaminase